MTAGISEPAVARQDRGAKHLGESYIGSVVSRDAVTQQPDSRQQLRMGMPRQSKRTEGIQSLPGLLSRYLPAKNIAAERLRDLEIRQMKDVKRVF